MVVIGIVAASPVRAQPLEDVLAIVYSGNPDLLAARQELAARDELRPQALAAWLPTVQFRGSQSRVETNFEDLPKNTTDETAVELNYTQNLWRSGSDTATLRGSELLIRQQRAILDDVEQSVLLQGVVAYMDVLRDQVVVELRTANVAALRELLRQTERQFEFGDKTLADLSQARAQLSFATADLIAAEGDVEASIARYIEVVGEPPGVLGPPPAPATLMTSLDEAIGLSASENPRVLAAEFASGAAEQNTTSIAGELGPSVDVVASVSNTDNDRSRLPKTERTESQLFFQLTVPLYQAGSVGSRLRQSRRVELQRRRQIEAERRTAVQSAESAWQVLEAARARIAALSEAIDAGRLALESVRREAQVGRRTTRDVLDQETDLINSQVSLVAARRDEIVAAYQVLQATGRLTARDLRLPVEYFDPTKNYEKNKWNLVPGIVPLMQGPPPE